MDKFDRTIQRELLNASVTFTQNLPTVASQRSFQKNLEALISLLPTYFILLVTDSLR